MSLATFLERNFPSVLDGLRIVKNRQFEVVPPRVIYATSELHAFIKARFGGRPGVFLEAGANNGLAQSNTAYLERYLGWRGVLVEAVPHKYVECKRNRPGSMVFHAALVSEEFAADYVPIHYSNLMSVVETATAVERKGHLDKGLSFLGGEANISGDVFYSPARTVTSIVTASGYKEIDLFSLDVEGAEIDVLRGIDFNVIRPKAFIIEARNVSEVADLLQGNGYVLEKQLTHHDYLFVDDATAQ